jgi:hypothetical protein
VAVVWWVIHSSLWTHSIHVSYYTSYLVPLGLVTLVLFTYSPLARLGSLQYRDTVALELGTLAALIAAHALVFRSGIAILPVAPRLDAIGAFAVCGMALASIRFARSSWIVWPAFVLTLWIAYGAVPMNWATAQTPHLQEDYTLSISAHRYLWEHLDNNRRLAIWYALRPDERRPYKNISSTYLWAWTYVNEDLPSLDEKLSPTVVPGAQLVLLIPDLGDTDRAKAALQKFDFDYTPREQQQFGPADASFWVIVGDLTRTQKADQ